MHVRVLKAALACVTLAVATACASDDPAVEYLLSQSSGVPMNPAPPPVIEGSFSLAINDMVGDPSFIFAAPGSPVDMFTVVLDITSPSTGTLVQIREMSGSRTGRVVFHAVPQPGGDLSGTYAINTVTNMVHVDYTYGGHHFAGDVRINNLLQINRTAYVAATLTSASTDPCAADHAAPSIDLSVTTARLWPANHEMVRVATGISATDNSGAAPALTVTVSSNESANGTGDGNTATDWRVVDNGAGGFDVFVRAERAGTGSGRVYTITATAVDQCSNSATATGTVLVPRSR